jgi:hypothetical protein
MTRPAPAPLKHCTNCGAGCDRVHQTYCPLCGEYAVEWVNLPAGLEFEANLIENGDVATGDIALLRAAAARLRTLQDTLDSIMEAAR